MRREKITGKSALGPSFCSTDLPMLVEEEEEEERCLAESAVEGTAGFFSVPTIFSLLLFALGSSARTLRSLEGDRVVRKERRCGRSGSPPQGVVSGLDGRR